MILLTDLQDISMMKYIDVINHVFSEMYGKYIRTDLVFYHLVYNL